jgi:Divergent InlB B-repeat domain
VTYKKLSFSLWLFFALIFGSLVANPPATAAQAVLTWSDNSTNEAGFYIERRVGMSGTYQQIASTGANSTSYTDPNLTSSTTYCYRVRAFDASGTSAYSNENCATTPAAAFSVTVTRAGTGSGNVTSSPAGISCGTDCVENYTSGAAVSLTPVALSGSVFAGWSGSAGCSTGNFTVNGNLNCTATFNLNPTGYTLTTSVINQVTSAGSASGRVVSNPIGIDCGTDCTEVYSVGKTVVLSAVPGSNSKFTGWTGSSDCSGGSVLMDANKNCAANFALNLVTLSITAGNGIVTGTPSAINCGTACSFSFVPGTSVSLRATAASGYSFSGWSGAGCTGTADCIFILSSNTTVTANFFKDLADKVGIYRPTTGEWLLDRNGNGIWEASIDLLVKPFAGTDGRPIVGDWNGSGKTKVGLFVPSSSGSPQWLLDANGNGIWDGCGSDICVNSFGISTDVPFAGHWTTPGYDRIAVFRPQEAKWYMDYDGDRTLEGCTTDKCGNLSIYRSGDLPLSGDWKGRGTTRFGLFRPSTGQWFLDGNADGTWDRCRKDICFDGFGLPGDIPVVGDWNGTGTSKIGVFRPNSGDWFLDLNGNGIWDGPTKDLYIRSFGQAGDMPVVGRW